MTKRVGRPIEKENRIKIGLSLDGRYNDMLKELSVQSGKSKSRLVEEAILLICDLENRNHKLDVVEHKNDKMKVTDNKNIENPFDSLRAMFNAKYS